MTVANTSRAESTFSKLYILAPPSPILTSLLYYSFSPPCQTLFSLEPLFLPSPFFFLPLSSLSLLLPSALTELSFSFSSPTHSHCFSLCSLFAFPLFHPLFCPPSPFLLPFLSTLFPLYCIYDGSTFVLFCIQVLLTVWTLEPTYSRACCMECIPISNVLEEPGVKAWRLENARRREKWTTGQNNCK